MVNKTTKKSGISVGELGLHNSKTPIAPVVVKAPVAKESIVKASVVKAPVEKASAVVQAVEKAPVAKETIAKEPVAKEPVAKEPVAKEPVAKEPVAKAPVAKAPVVAHVEKVPVAKAHVVAKAPLVVPAVVAKIPSVEKAPVEAKALTVPHVVESAIVAKTPAVVQAVVGKTPVVEKASAVVQAVVGKTPVVAKESVAKAPVVVPVVAKESVAKIPVVVPVVAKAPVIVPVVAKAPVVVGKASAVVPVVAKAPVVVGKASAVVPVVAKESVAKAPVVVPVVAKESVAKAPVVVPVVAKESVAKASVVVPVVAKAPVVVGKASAVVPVVAKESVAKESVAKESLAKASVVVGGAGPVEGPGEKRPFRVSPIVNPPKLPSINEEGPNNLDNIYDDNSAGVTAAPAEKLPTKETKDTPPAAVPEPSPAPAPATAEITATETPASATAAATTATPPAPAATGELQPASTPTAEEKAATAPPLTASTASGPPAEEKAATEPPLITAAAPGQPSTTETPAEITASTEREELQPDGIVTNIDIKDVQKGGSPMDNNLYKLFTSILLLTSCLLFCIATVLFINACINFHKAKNEFMKDENKEPIIEQPIFEYLKPNNFLYIDKFLLDVKESQSPVVITFGIIIAISFTCLGGLIAYWSQNERNTFNNWRSSLTISSSLKYLPILYIFIIGNVFNNSIITANKNTLKTFEDEFDNTIINFNFEGIAKDNDKKKLFLEELKKILIQEIYNNYKNDYSEYNEGTITAELATKLELGLTTTNIQKIFGTSNNTKYTIPQVIFYIYKLSYYYFKKQEKTTIEYDKLIKDNIQEYINRIDRYFNLLINDINNNSTNYYTKFYLISLIKKDSFVDIEKFNKSIIEKVRIDYRNDINALKTLNGNFNEKIESIKNRIQSYYIVIIVFYLLLLIGLIYYFKNPHDLWIFLCNLLFIYNIDILRAFISIIIIIIVLTVLFTLRNYKI